MVPQKMLGSRAGVAACGTLGRSCVSPLHEQRLGHQYLVCQTSCCGHTPTQCFTKTGLADIRCLLMLCANWQGQCKRAPIETSWNACPSAALP